MNKKIAFFILTLCFSTASYSTSIHKTMSNEEYLDKVSKGELLVEIIALSADDGRHPVNVYHNTYEVSNENTVLENGKVMPGAVQLELPNVAKMYDVFLPFMDVPQLYVWFKSPDPKLFGHNGGFYMFNRKRINQWDKLQGGMCRHLKYADMTKYQGQLYVIGTIVLGNRPSHRICYLTAEIFGHDMGTMLQNQLDFHPVRFINIGDERPLLVFGKNEEGKLSIFHLKGRGVKSDLLRVLTDEEKELVMGLF